MNIAKSNVSGISLRIVVQKLMEFAPLSLAQSWDNVGLLVEPCRERLVSSILLTNDLTEDVMDEAIDVSADLIISYHPPIFAPLKRITNSSWKERIVARCLANDIALFSPHTCWDAAPGGINDWLASAFECKTVKPLNKEPGISSKSSTCILTVETKDNDQLLALIGQELATRQLETEFKVLLSEKSISPSDTTLAATKLTIQCSKNAAKVISPMLTTNNSVSYYYVTPGLSFGADKEPNFGCGCLCELKVATSIADAVDKLKKHIGVPHVQLALARHKKEDDFVETVAFVAGSGASLLKNIQCDLKITGEASHHEVLEFVHSGSSVILTNHSNSERGFLYRFKDILSSKLPPNSANIAVSSRDADPLTVV